MSRSSRAVPYPVSFEDLSAREIETLRSWVIDDRKCWVWQRGKSNGYAVLHCATGRIFQAHRLIYTLVRGEVPAGFDIDHLCRNRACVKPTHLEAVPHGENVRRAYDPVYNAERAA